MSWGFDTVKDGIEVAVWIIGFIAIFYAIRTFRVTNNQFQFDVMLSCIERFQKLVPTLDIENPDTIQKYVDLCNEELFYITNDYLPKEVVREWLDGMIQELPHINDAGQNLNDKSLVKIEDLTDYPRIRNAFKVTKHYNLKNINDRQALINSIQKQMKNYSWDLSNIKNSTEQ